jgi:LPS O-antigen subunit length determinant protein (WzzB/FepE family)
LYRHKIALFIWTFLAAAATAGYSLTIPRSYQAVATLRLVTPVENQSTLNSALGSLGGLGSLFGANLPTDDTAVTLAYFRSPSFARSFVEDNNLLPELYPTRWDGAQNRWIREPPSLDRAAAGFLNRVRTERDPEGLVKLEVVWNSPPRAREIAEQLIERINQLRRDQALEKAKGNFDYLTQRMAKEPVQEMRNTIANMASRELTLLMLAEGPSHYALEEIGAVFAPEIPFSPRRRTMTMVGALAGFCLCAIFLLLRQALRKP